VPCCRLTTNLRSGRSRARWRRGAAHLAVHAGTRARPSTDSRAWVKAINSAGKRCFLVFGVLLCLDRARARRSTSRGAPRLRSPPAAYGVSVAVWIGVAERAGRCETVRARRHVRVSTN
jgi:hypothetical protein